VIVVVVAAVTLDLSIGRSSPDQEAESPDTPDFEA